MTGVLRRELERQQTLLDVKKCQEYQMEEKLVKRAHDRKISECYKFQAIGMADDARDKAAMEARDKTELVQGWGKQYLAEMEDKKARQHEQDLQEKDAAAKAKCQVRVISTFGKTTPTLDPIWLEISRSFNKPF